MNHLDCAVMEDLAPLYTEQLVNTHTSQLIQAHLKECERCRDLYKKSDVKIEVTFDHSPVSKKMLFHVHRIRLWYLLCPLIAFLLSYNQLDNILHLYTGTLIIFTGICISSQFFSGISMRGFDMEQYELYKEAEKRDRSKFGTFYSSPLSVCLPCILILLISFISTYNH